MPTEPRSRQTGVKGASAAKKSTAKKSTAKKSTGKKPAAKKSAAAKKASTKRTQPDPARSKGSGSDETPDHDPDDVHQSDDQGSNPWGVPFGFGSSPPDFGDLGEFIRNQRELAKLSVRRLAELADVSNPYLSQVERGLRKPSADILQQVANALRISVESLYVRAGFLPDQERTVSTVAEAIEHDPRLSDEQKQALRNVYDSFVGHA